MNHYEKAIDILTGITKEEAYRLVFEIAKKNPGCIVKAHGRFGWPKVEDQIRSMAASCSTKIMCIKKYRELTNASLYDAKREVERIVPSFKSN